MEQIFEGVKEIGVQIYQAIKEGETGKAETFNTSGDQQIKLDILSDQIVEGVLREIDSVKEIISEEKSEPVRFREEGYLVAYDPLDGSSLVDADLTIGSIFGIYTGGYTGKDIITAGYLLYGPRLELVWATGEGVRHYRFKKGEFQLVGELKLGERGKILGPGGTQAKWYKFHKELIDSLFQKGYRLRYSGGMVPDIHQILVKGGGLFAYPGTTDRPQGKLRKLFEVFPFALIVEKAGGLAVDGVRRLLELGYSGYADTTPCFFGSRAEVEEVLEVYRANTPFK
ncbi:MAG: class 1 fructose-bisphosphatase [Campylobacterales bacterium]